MAQRVRPSDMSTAPSPGHDYQHNAEQGHCADDAPAARAGAMRRQRHAGHDKRHACHGQ